MVKRLRPTIDYINSALAMTERPVGRDHIARALRLAQRAYFANRSKANWQDLVLLLVIGILALCGCLFIITAIAVAAGWTNPCELYQTITP